MDCNPKDGYKHLPFRCHRGDQFSIALQRLVKPVDETEAHKTLGDLITLILPGDNESSRKFFLYLAFYNFIKSESSLFLGQF